METRRSSVFSIPRRDVVEPDEYTYARKLNGDSLGSQSWWLFPRIRETDVFLQEYKDAKEKVFESHPAICFTELAVDSYAGKPPKMAAKSGLRF